MMAGNLDRRIRFQRFYETADSVGEPVRTWADFEEHAEAWAQYVPLSTREQFAAQQLGAEAVVKFRIRYRDDLSVENRIVYRGDAYDIQGISEVGRRDGLEIVARKVAT